MTLSHMLDDLARRGIRVTAESGRLVIDAPRGALTAEDRASLARHKGEILEVLATPAKTTPAPLPWRATLATWSEERRERWGRRANDLEGAGLSWREAEDRAFSEVSAERGGAV